MFLPEWAMSSLAVLILAAGSTEGQTVAQRVATDLVLEYGKAIDVSRLDPALQSEPLGSWFFSIVGPRVDYLVWSAVDCGQPKDAPPDTPRCLRVEAKWRQDLAAVVATVDVRVATSRDSPLSERPDVFAVSVRTAARAGASDAESDAIFHIWEAQRLAELEDLLEKAAARGRVAARSKPPTAVEEPHNVSMIQLIANPDQFEGKRVRLAGYANFESEGDALYLHREDFDATLLPNAVRLRIPRKQEEYRSLSRMYVILEGRFSRGERDTFSKYAGVVSDVTLLQRLPARVEFVPQAAR